MADPPRRDARPGFERPEAVGLIERLRSAYYELGLGFSERIGRVRRAKPEVPAGTLPPLGAAARARVLELRTQLKTPFEDSLGAASALQNYVYLDWLVSLYASAGRQPPAGGEVQDVGSASFWYAAALAAFFRPSHLIGIELEGKRRLAGRTNRHERALGYLASLGSAEFVVADYSSYTRPCRVITAFFPFVTTHPVLAWRLPLRVLAPDRLLARIAANLQPGGEFVMVNHSPQEAALAAGHAGHAGLRCLGRYEDTQPIVPRPARAVATLWEAR